MFASLLKLTAVIDLMVENTCNAFSHCIYGDAGVLGTQPDVTKFALAP